MRTARFASHVHSAWSDDASWTLDDLRDALRKRGYDGALMCEHDRGFTENRWQEYREECIRASRDGFLFVPGIEYGDVDNVVHLPAWGPLPFLGEGRDPGTLLGHIAEEGGLAVLAHPWRRDAWERFDPGWAPHLLAVEIWNRKYDGIACERRALQLAQDEGLRPFVALDFHTSRQFFPLATRLQVQELTAAATFAALQEGRWRPEFLGRSALRFTGGLPGTALAGLESARRAARRVVRRARDPRG